MLTQQTIEELIADYRQYRMQTIESGCDAASLYDWLTDGVDNNFKHSEAVQVYRSYNRHNKPAMFRPYDEPETLTETAIACALFLACLVGLLVGFIAFAPL